ncbi:MAG: hypothetical protein H7Y19_07300 [Luteimonas sp.]|nr:hypothetical protein [Luteimonas sp.]
MTMPIGRTELNKAWDVCPELLSPLDADIVRSIAGELTDSFMQRMMSRENFVVRKRLAELLRKHSCGPFSDLAMLAPERRRQLAETIIKAELAERELNDGATAELPELPGRPAGRLNQPTKNCKQS